NVCVAAGPEVRVGKNRDNDVVLRVLPRSAENDVCTDRISRFHAALQFTPDGLLWSDRSSSGTMANGQLHRAGMTCRVAHGMTLTLAGVLTFRCELTFATSDATGESYRQLEEKLGHTAAPPACPVQAARLRRQDELAELEEYLLFPRGASVGSGPA